MITEKSELKNRVEAKVKEMEAKMAKLKADGKDESQKRLENLRQQKLEAQKMISKGWDQMTEDVAAKLNDWLKKS